MIEYRIENSGIPLDKEKISDDKMVTIRSIFNECNATNSEPALIGYMVQQVLPENDMPGQELTALEVGCGTGYVVKILREVGFQHVVGIERKPHLAEKARALLSDDPQVVIICQDGKAGLPDKKFDAIIVSALVTDSDVLSTLISQLKDKNSKLVLPIALSLLAEKDIIPKRVFEETNSDPREGVLYVGNKGENGRFALAPKIPVQFVYLD
jgi:protein-L-isoaspartate O-methyltransferase